MPYSYPLRFPSPHSITLAAGGVAQVDIVVPATVDVDAILRERHNYGIGETAKRRHAIAYAASDLQDVLGRITGGTFRIVTSADGANGIVLGTPSDFGIVLGPEGVDSLAFGADGFDGVEAFYIRTEPQRLLLLANTYYGVNHAVQHLLHALGYRHFLMGKHWEIVPSSPEVSVSIHIGDRPAFYHRVPTLASRDLDLPTPTAQADLHFWHRRMRAGYMFGSMPKISTSGWSAVLTKNWPELNAHPEMILGYRSGIYTGRPSTHRKRGGFKLDVSNERVRELFLIYARRIVEAAEGIEPVFIPMEPTDGAGFYLDDMVDPGWYASSVPPGTWTGSISDHVFALANYVVETISSEYPARTIWAALLAYNQHDAPPLFDLDPRVLIIAAPAFRKTPGYTDEEWLRAGYTAKEWLRAWSAKTQPPLGIYPLLSESQKDQDEPPGPSSTTTRYLDEYFRRFVYATGVRIFFGEMNANMGRGGLAYYLMYQALWNPHADLGNARRDFLEKAFGIAATSMEKYYDIMSADNAYLPTWNTWSQALTYLDRAGREAAAAGDTAAVERINEIKYWWYYLHLRARLHENPDDYESETQFRNHFFRQGLSYSVSWAGYHRQVKGFPRNTTPRLWLGSLVASHCTGGRACSDPEWTAYGYTHEEVDRWWGDVVVHYQYVPLRSIGYSFDLVPVQDFARLVADNDLPPQVLARGTAILQAWTFSFHGESVAFKIYRLEPHYNEADDCAFTLSAQTGAVLRSERRVHPLNKPLLLEFSVPAAGAYRLTFRSKAKSYYLKTNSGYPLSLGYTQEYASRFADLGAPLRWVFYVPRNVASVHFDAILADASRVRVPQSGLGSMRDRDFREVDLPAYPGGPSRSGGATRIEALPHERGAIWQLDGKPQVLQLFSVPNQISTHGAYLMVPNAVAAIDGLTRATDPLGGHIIRITVRPTATAPVSEKFLGDYREVLSAPPLPAALMPTYSSAWSPADTGAFDQTMIWQNMRVTSIYLIRGIAREWPDVPGRSHGFFILYDSASETTAEWYRAPALSTSDVYAHRGWDIPRLRRTWERLSGPDTPGATSVNDVLDLRYDGFHS